MIHYDRSTVEVPAALKGKGAGCKERRNNAKHIANGEANKVKLEAYKDQTVRDALKSLFGRKCVFCESSLLGNQPGDIEHFRPKGKVYVLNPVTGKQEKVAGYVWLASHWDNLLLACADCNRPRKQADVGGVIRTMGKSCHFPLAPGSKRAKRAWEVRRESPLLLNPCIDDPAEHIEFCDMGAIMPKGASAMGQATIECCGLDRAELLEARLRHRRTVMAAIRHTVSALESDRDPGGDLDDLVELLLPTSPFVAYTRHLVRENMGPYLATLGFVA